MGASFIQTGHFKLGKRREIRYGKAVREIKLGKGESLTWDGRN
jgi:hypothetical protein